MARGHGTYEIASKSTKTDTVRFGKPLGRARISEPSQVAATPDFPYVGKLTPP
jgi:hypothetical protein